MSKNKLVKFQIRHAILFAGILALICVTFFIMVVRQYDQYVEQDEIALQRYFCDFKEQLNSKFYQLENRLKQIRYSVEADLQDSRETGVKFPTIHKFLKENTAEKRFHMDNVDKTEKIRVNINITGSGKFRNRDKKFERILKMGLGLYDEFHALKETIPNIMYIYYTSTEKMIVHYPWFHSKEFRFSKNLYDYELWKLSIPENNSMREIYWTDPYIDSSGENGGIMITCAIPIYDKNDFIGLIGADLTVDFLNLLVAKFEPQRKGNTVIFDDKQSLMAHPASISFEDKSIKKLKDGLPVEMASAIKTILKAPDNTILKIGKWKYIKSRFGHTPFNILYYFPQTYPVNNIVGKIGYGTLGVIACMFILVFVSLYITHKKLIHPTEKFVNFILAKSNSKEIHSDKKLPGMWKPWFSTIDNVFNENNKLNESIKQHNTTLENKNTELQKEIEAKNKAEKEKEALEKQLIEEEKLKAIGLLVGGIAHDFNNQLAIIMGYTSILRSNANISEDKKKQCLNQMLSASESSSGLIKQLLAFAQKGKYQNIPVDIHEIINDMISILNHTIDKRITIKVDFAANLYTIQGDRSQVQNAIMNIAINAKNAMPGGGMITFKTVNETLTEEQCKHSEFNLQAGEFIKISVIDTGTGITAENKKHIFKPFFTTKNSGRGTGLGLAAALGAIKNHNGYITLENTPGMGANFSILLPVMKKNVIGKSAKIKKINVSKSESKLLLIDDEEEFCRMLTDFMGALGYTIITYTDPLKAMEYYKKSWEEVDLVIMDMIMPKISGDDMINEFQKINPLAKIVISSGYSEERDVQKLFKSHEHILGFYKKPFDLIKFANDIAALLKQEG